MKQVETEIRRIGHSVIELSASEFRNQIANIDPDSPLYVYCTILSGTGYGNLRTAVIQNDFASAIVGAIPGFKLDQFQ